MTFKQKEVFNAKERISKLLNYKLFFLINEKSQTNLYYK